MEWDPIGVPGVPEAAQEYDCMISPPLHYLFEGAESVNLLIGSVKSSHPTSVSDLTTLATASSRSVSRHSGTSGGPPLSGTLEPIRKTAGPNAYASQPPTT
jgi:hypothetical protein